MSDKIKVGGMDVVFDKEVKAGVKLSAKDVKMFNGKTPGDKLPATLIDFF